jgi:hypothetical protein
VEEFRGILVDKTKLRNPSEDRFDNPATYLFQLGYLSLRPGGTKEEYLLDYPNYEVRSSMARRLLERYFKSERDADRTIAVLLGALKERDPTGVVKTLNWLLAKIPYDDYYSAKEEETEEMKGKIESFYRSNMCSLFYGAGLDPRPEVHGNFGRADIIVDMVYQTWVIEVKVCRDDKDLELAADALKQIKETNYGGGHKNPVSLGLVVNNKARAILAWECEGGLASNPEKLGRSVKPAKPKKGTAPTISAKTKKPAKSKVSLEPEEEEDRPGPRPR